MKTSFLSHDEVKNGQSMIHPALPQIAFGHFAPVLMLLDVAFGLDVAHHRSSGGNDEEGKDQWTRLFNWLSQFEARGEKTITTNNAKFVIKKSSSFQVLPLLCGFYEFLNRPSGNLAKNTITI